MAVVDDIYGNMPRVTFDLEEGDFTFKVQNTQRGKEAGGEFSAELYEGANLQVYADADETLELASDGRVVGILVGDPIGPLPITSAPSKTYKRRYGPVVLFGDLVRLELIETNQAIKPGDSLGIASGSYTYDKEEDELTDVVALQARSASKGGYIMAIALKNAPAVVKD